MLGVSETVSEAKEMAAGWSWEDRGVKVLVPSPACLQ